MRTSRPGQDSGGERCDASFLAIFRVFLALGLTSFGGPVAHLAYFRQAFVERLRWLDEARYGELVALCQFLPGPASSQAGFALGVLRGNGLAGGLAAWLGFTLPSAIVLCLFAFGAGALSGPLAGGVLHGLKLVAVAVVAHALWGMARSLTPDWQRAGIACAALALVLIDHHPAIQIAAIALGMLAGLWLCRIPATAEAGCLTFPVDRRAGVTALLLFAVLLAGLPLAAAITRDPGVALFASFYRSGALVFGGGHVVLPLLQAETVVPGFVSEQAFLAGYGMAQAMPGPLFTFAAYLGALHTQAGGAIGGAAIALVAVFVPGLLLVYGALPFWDRLRACPRAQHALRGANAAVVGILGAAFHDPVWTGAVFDAGDFALVSAGFLLLARWKVAPWIVVALLTVAGILRAIW